MRFGVTSVVPAVVAVACMLLCGCRNDVPLTGNPEVAARPVVELRHDYRMFTPGKKITVFGDGRAVNDDHGTKTSFVVEPDEVAKIIGVLEQTGYFSFRERDILDELALINEAKDLRGDFGASHLFVVDGSVTTLSVNWMNLSNVVTWTNLDVYRSVDPESTNLARIQNWFSLVGEIHRK